MEKRGGKKNLKLVTVSTSTPSSGAVTAAVRARDLHPARRSTLSRRPARTSSLAFDQEMAFFKLFISLRVKKYKEGGKRTGREMLQFLPPAVTRLKLPDRERRHPPRWTEDMRHSAGTGCYFAAQPRDEDIKRARADLRTRTKAISLPRKWWRWRW